MFSEQSTTRTRNRITPRRTACTWAGTKQHRQRRHLRGHAGGRDPGRECTRAARAAAWGYLTVSATPRSRAAVLRAGFLTTRSSPFSSSRKRSSGISCICMGPDHRAILRPVRTVLLARSPRRFFPSFHEPFPRTRQCAVLGCRPVPTSARAFASVRLLRARHPCHARSRSLPLSPALFVDLPCRACCRASKVEWGI
jgi:hypothetical protein